MEEIYDLSGFVCPLSKIKASQAVDSTSAGDTAVIILGDVESLKSVAQELKTKGIQPAFKQESDTRYILTVTR